MLSFTVTCFDTTVQGHALEETLEIKQIPHLQKKLRPREVRPKVAQLISGPGEKMKSCLFFLRAFLVAPLREFML